jgi:sugar phosphate isomerase/epimerase
MAGAASMAFGAPAGRGIRLGGPVFVKSGDPRELAREHRRLGYSAGLCPRAKADDSEKTREIEKAFAAENVVIAEVGAWVNMLDPDAEKRRANMRFVAERLALAEAVGARCCVNTAGSFATRGPHPDDLSPKHFDATVENCRRLIDEVKVKRTRFAIEMMSWCLPDSPEAYVKLVRAVDRKGFGVHLDPCNGINCAARYYRSGEFIAECVRQLGQWIVSCHAKDLEMLPESNIHLQEVVPGRGQVDYRTYLRALAKLPGDTPLLLEHLKTAEEYDEGAKYVRRIAAEVGVAFL